MFIGNDRDHQQILQAFQRRDGNAVYDFSEAYLINTLKAIIACVARAGTGGAVAPAISGAMTGASWLYEA